MSQMNITSNDKRLFSKLVRDKGFQYSLRYFLLEIFDYNKYYIELSSLIWGELDKIKALDAEEYNKRNFRHDLFNIINDPLLPDDLKILLLTQIIIKTVENNNLEEFKENVLNNLISILFNETDNHFVVIKTLLIVFNRSILYEKNSHKQISFYEILVGSLSYHNVTLQPQIIDTFLAHLLLVIYIYVYYDKLVERKYKENIIRLIARKHSNDLTGARYSLISIIKERINDVLSVFPKNRKELLLDDDSMTYSPKKKLYSKMGLVNTSLITEVNFALHYLLKEGNLTIFDFISKDMGPLDKKTILDYLITSFVFPGGDNLMLSDKTKENIDNVISLLNVSTQFIDFRNINDIFTIINEERNLYAYIEDGKTMISINKVDYAVLHEDENEITITINIDNKEIYGASIVKQENYADLIEFSLGYNNIEIYTNEIVASLFNSQMVSYALMFLFQKHLDRIELENDENAVAELKMYISDYKVNKYNINDLWLFSGSYEKIKETLQYLTRENRNINGLANVYINTNNFRFSFEPVVLKRRRINSDEIPKLLEDKRISSGIYKIDDIFLGYDKAFQSIKNNYWQDIFLFKYTYYSKDKAGFYISFK